MNKNLIQEGLEAMETYEKAGIEWYTKDFATKLLAYFQVNSFVLGEEFVINKPLCFALLACKKKLCIESGKTPDIQLVIDIQNHVKELQANPKIPWALEIEKRYDITQRKGTKRKPKK